MDFHLSPAQLDIQEHAQRLLREDFSTTRLREAEAADGFPREIWDAGVRLGWSAMLTDKTSSHGLLDLCILLNETGRAGATLPLVTSAGVAVTLLRESPPAAHRDQLLESIGTGGIVAPALVDEVSRNEWDPPRLPLRPDGDSYRLHGTKVLVPFAAVADDFLVTASTANGSAAIVAVQSGADGVTVTPHQARIGTPLASITFDDVAVSAAQVIHEGDGAATAIATGLQAGTLLSTAEAVGMCDALTTITAEYVTQREAFGRRIGTFQGVSHPCADMRIHTDVVRILVQQAAWLVDNGRSADEEIPATKALANELFEVIALDAYRLHGAFGFSEECDVQLFMRRLQGFYGSFGETQESFERAATALGL